MYAKRGEFLKKKRKIARKIILITLVTFIVTVISFSLYVYAKLNKTVDIALFERRDSSITRIFYYDFQDRKNRIGEAIEIEDEAIFIERSEWKSVYEVPAHLKNAFIAIEDKRFYDHSGVDWLRTAKATFNYLFKLLFIHIAFYILIKLSLIKKSSITEIKPIVPLSEI